MASPSAVAIKANPLTSEDRLGAPKFLHQPSTFTPSSPTIVLLTWMNASPIQIAFYVKKYTITVPNARLILIPGTVANMVYIPYRTQQLTLGPIITTLRAEQASPIFLHLFSNAGAQSASTLLRAWKESSPEEKEIMPVKGIIFDSTPSFGTYDSAYAGMSFQIPRNPIIYLPGLALVHALISSMLLVEKFSGNPNVLTRSNRDLNDENLVPKDACRVYLYSKEDQLVEWKAVEAHALKAKESGWEVSMELFEGTEHCRHGEGKGEQRYWTVIEAILEGGTHHCGG